jgi:2-methylisocitrate lyase-like PEP mutase family enzyme
MEHGRLAVCGVTKDFTYGANVPCTSVLVDRDFLTKHSANTLRQFIGRVARTGLAPFGVAQFEDDEFLPKMCGKNDNQESLCMEATAKAIIAAATATKPPVDTD